MRVGQSDGDGVYVVVWKFQVAEEHQEAFERAYGPHGDWTRLFERGKDFQGTELLRADTSARDYVTIDRWTSRDAFLAFKERFAREYDELDTRFLELCEVEVCLGKFEVVA